MNYRDNKTPCSDRAAVAVPVPSDHLYQFAAVAFVLFLLATMI